MDGIQVHVTNTSNCRSSARKRIPTLVENMGWWPIRAAPVVARGGQPCAPDRALEDGTVFGCRSDSH